MGYHPLPYKSMSCDTCPDTFVANKRHPGSDGKVRYPSCQDLRKLAILRSKYLKKQYGPDFDYDKMFLNQGGCCKICAYIPRILESLDVDHNHQTGKIRALLCWRCNASMGKFGDDPVLIQKVVDYLYFYDGKPTP